MAKQRNRPTRARTLRRAQQRVANKLSQSQERLFQMERGGNPDRPIEIQSAALVEPKAADLKCPTCALGFRVEDHRAQTIHGARLREAVVLCTGCGKRRSIWFRLIDELN